jgi:hypothetical protein
MARRVDAYLSRQAQAQWSTALVYCDSDPNKETWTLEKHVTSGGFRSEMGLGSSFAEAKASLGILIKAEVERAKIETPLIASGIENPSQNENIIGDTAHRLYAESFTSGVMEKLSADTREEFNTFVARMIKEKPDANILQANLAALVVKVSMLITEVNISMGINQKIMQTILEHLHEKSHREVRRILENLKLGDISIREQ